ncbi:uncharacterized protein METZ01_LOCUS89840 [marine metagenome]|uniref:DNA topoisomerase (ATP-hydrolyzing) n=1 Tax=marine metagenome TaxID=408172 RepID=A0A381V9C6_9ZZZZ
MDIRTLLKDWLKFRSQTVTRRLEHRLDWVMDRLHILDGLMVVYLNLDAVIKIIRNEEDPRKSLQKKFKLSLIQVDATLEIRLKQLAKLEEEKIKLEQEALETERKDLEKILKSKTRLKTLIKRELKTDSEIHGDERKSRIIERSEATAFDESELISSDPVTIILSKLGWIRAAKGYEVDIENMNYREGDGYLTSSKGRNNQNAVFFDSKGRAYTLPCHSLPSARGQGEPLTGRLNVESGETFLGVASGTKEDKIVLATDAGYGFIAKLGDLETKNKSGKGVLKLPDGGKVLFPQRIKTNKDRIVAISNEGRMLVFSISELPELSKGRGNKILGIPKERYISGHEKLHSIVVISEGNDLKLINGKRHFTVKEKDISNFEGSRGRRGSLLPKVFRKIDSVEVLDLKESREASLDEE